MADGIGLDDRTGRWSLDLYGDVVLLGLSVVLIIVFLIYHMESLDTL